MSRYIPSKTWFTIQHSISQAFVVSQRPKIPLEIIRTFQVFVMIGAFRKETQEWVYCSEAGARQGTLQRKGRAHLYWYMRVMASYLSVYINARSCAIRRKLQALSVWLTIMMHNSKILHRCENNNYHYTKSRTLGIH